MPFITSSDQRWQSLLDAAPHDVYHLQGFTRIEAELLKGEAIAWYHEGRGNVSLIPLVSRNIRGDETFSDLVSPYGYPGILSLKQPDVAEASEILAVFNKEAAAHGYVSSFLRLNPLLNQWQLPQTESWRQWFHGGTVSVDLSVEGEQLRSHYAENHRRNLKSLKQLGYTVAFDQWQFLPDFLNAYRQTMQRRNAHPYYFFPESYFQSLKQLLGEKLIFASVVTPSGEFAAGGLFTQFGTLMQYHLGATMNDFLAHSPSKLMMDAAIEEGKRREATILHLGGGLGGSTVDGLFRFKKGFARDYHAYTSLRFIHLPSVYENLKASLGKGYNRNTYFPEYRILIDE